MPNRSIISICPHCGDEARGYLFLTPDGHTIRSYWCREHGDVVPRGNDDDDDKEHSSLPDVQNGVRDEIDFRDCAGKSILSESEVRGYVGG